MQLGLNMFHERHPDCGLLLNVTRHPYSFNGDSRRGSLAGHGTKEGNEPTWHDSLLGYCGGDAAKRDAAEDGMRTLGRRAGIELDYGVQTNWQPIDSQRSMLWARRFGLAEEFMDHLGHRHFEQRKSASHRATLLDAAAAAGLDASALGAFLDSDELVADVAAAKAQLALRVAVDAFERGDGDSPEGKTLLADAEAAAAAAATAAEATGDPDHPRVGVAVACSADVYVAKAVLAAKGKGGVGDGAGVLFADGLYRNACLLYTSPSPRD